MGIFDRLRGKGPSKQEQQWQAPEQPKAPDEQPEQSKKWTSNYSLGDYNTISEKLEQQGVDVARLEEEFSRGQSLQVSNPDIVEYFKVFSEVVLKTPVEEVRLDKNFKLPEGYDWREDEKYNMAVYAEELTDDNPDLVLFVDNIRSRMQHNGMVMAAYYLGKDDSKIKWELIINAQKYEQRKKEE